MKNTKLDFEIDLLPVISLLAVCISFLLLTAVWVQIGSTDISQAMGDQAQKTTEEPALWVEFTTAGQMQVKLKNIRKAPAQLRRFVMNIPGKNKKSWKRFEQHAERIKKSYPELKTAMILPKVNSSYDDIIRVIDGFKKNEITDIGVAPL